RDPPSRPPATARRPPRPAAGRRGARARPPEAGTRPRPTTGRRARPWRLRGSRAGLYNRPSMLEGDRDGPRPIGSKHLGAGRADPVEDLGDGVAVGVRADADDGHL